MLLYSGQERPTEQLLMIQVHRMNKIRCICVFFLAPSKQVMLFMIALRCLLISFLLFRQKLPKTYWKIYNNVSLWRRNFFLVFSKSSSLLNKMISHDMLDTVGFQSERVSNFLRCLLNSSSWYKVAPTDCKMPV